MKGPSDLNLAHWFLQVRRLRALAVVPFLHEENLQHYTHIHHSSRELLRVLLLLCKFLCISSAVHGQVCNLDRRLALLVPRIFQGISAREGSSRGAATATASDAGKCCCWQEMLLQDRRLLHLPCCRRFVLLSSQLLRLSRRRN